MIYLPVLSIVYLMRPSVVGQVHLIVVISKQTQTHHTLVRTSLNQDQLVAEAVTYAIHDKHKTRKSMLLAGFDNAVSPIKRLHSL